jgi:hypothetical protein
MKQGKGNEQERQERSVERKRRRRMKEGWEEVSMRRPSKSKKETKKGPKANEAGRFLLAPRCCLFPVPQQRRLD